ncbi:MAG: glycoside hydrolase family 3 C-terminal domain-containing protein, partial [Anaerolineae bacterium]|nr:glycoside hydrolase family 3 C-terminal domain-containing protein [Anaerolineae bacterium]
MPENTIESRSNELLARMTLEEKIGQMAQLNGAERGYEERIRQGQVGSFLNVVDVETYNRYQRIAMEESRLGIPLIMGRDVIHGFRTVFPIPLGQSAAWHPELVEQAAAIAAREASSMGVNWTFAPMVDVARDPRWGRIAEGGGEDPYLTSQLGRAMVRGFQGEAPSAPDRIAACAKHYVGYGAAEGGRDYNTTPIPEGTLRDVYLPPFKACVEAGAATVMSAFNEINGIPATGNAFTLRQILKGEWEFDGFVVSDWGSVVEMVVHGFCADEKDAARAAVTAGVDMEMVSQSYRQHLAALVAEGKVPLELIDEAVRRILRIKMRLGLFENPYVDPARQSVLLAPEHLEVARQLARESVVLLKNEEDVLPLSGDVRAIAVIGPLADAPADQLGCWVFDGRPEDTITPLRALQERLKGKAKILFAPGLESPRSESRKGFDEALEAARKADVVLLFVGEDAILSGEAHCRAFLDLPGAQEALVEAVAAEGKPTVAIVMTGRPLTLSRVVDKVHALLIAWHPGTMGGPAIVDLLFGDESPSGKLPVTFPRTVGQIPIYYAHKNTGRPPQQLDRKIPLGTPLD